jgi:hypothetical protein
MLAAQLTAEVLESLILPDNEDAGPDFEGMAGRRSFDF